jgi:succinate dehydrogenase/fumarate reductase-like Fe-S protein
MYGGRNEAVEGAQRRPPRCRNWRFRTFQKQGQAIYRLSDCMLCGSALAADRPWDVKNLQFFAPLSDAPELFSPPASSDGDCHE